MISLTDDVSTYRKVEYDVDPLFINRWSPRAMSGQEVSLSELMTLLEAAHWAPSSYNNQPWRFIYARRRTAAWDVLFNLLNEHNQSWAKNAGALILIISKRTLDNGKPASTHSFDTGSAWMSLALQGSLRGLVVHGMEGFDYRKAGEALNIPSEYQVEAMAAVGHPGSPESLPKDQQAREFPSNRKRLSDVVFEGTFTLSSGNM